MSQLGKIDEIIDDLKKRINNGEFGIGRMPTQEELRREYRVNGVTINECMQNLHAAGMVWRRGPNVYAHPTPPVRIIGGMTANFKEYAKQLGYDIIEKDIILEIVPMSKEIASIFKKDAGSPVVRRLRLQSSLSIAETSGEIHRVSVDSAFPFRIAENFYDATLLDAELFEEMQADPYYDALEAIKRKHQVFGVHGVDEILARQPDKFERELLRQVRSSSLITIQRTVTSENGRVVIYSHIRARAEMFVKVYSYPIEHWK